MLQTFLSSAVAFLQGKLFQDQKMVAVRGGIGIVVVLAVLFLLNGFLPLWLAVVLAGFIGGLLQPRLFRDLKYR